MSTTAQLVWSVDAIVVFLTFFIPGFISVKTYELKVPSRNRDISNTIFEIVGYSALNYILLSPVIFLVYKTFLPLSWMALLIQADETFAAIGPWKYYLLLFAVLIIFPMIWAGIIYYLRWIDIITEHVRPPIPTPWDYLFGDHPKNPRNDSKDPKKPWYKVSSAHLSDGSKNPQNRKPGYWVIVGLKDGNKIGGIFDNRSFASRYPHEEQIYLSRVVPLDEDGWFDEAYDYDKDVYSKGVLISGSDIYHMAFYEGQKRIGTNAAAETI